MSARDGIHRYDEYSNKFRKYVNGLIEQSRRLYPTALQILADRRRMPKRIFEEAEVFYIGKMQEMLLPEFIDDIGMFGVINANNERPIFEERWVFPIKDYCGNIINLVGYTWMHDVRYVYGTGKYYERSNDFYGAERLNAIYKEGWGIVVEGITDCVALRSIGMWNSLAWCGTTKSVVKVNQLERLKFGAIFIHDRDEAGDKTREHWIIPRCARINIASGNKDIDEYLHSREITSNEELESRETELRLTVMDSSNWLKQGLNNAGHIEKGFTLF